MSRTHWPFTKLLGSQLGLRMPEFPSLFKLKLSRPLQKKFYIKAALMSYSTESNNNKKNKRKYQKERHCSKPKHHTDNKESIH